MRDFDLKTIMKATAVVMPRELRHFMTRNIFNRAARAMANRDDRDYESRRNVYRYAIAPDNQTMYWSFARWRLPWKRSTLTCSAPTADFEHDVSLTYIGEVNGEHRFRYALRRHSKTDAANKTVLLGVALVKDNRLQTIHLGFEKDPPQHHAGKNKGHYRDLVPDYAEAAFLTPTPKATHLRMALG